MSVLQLTPTFDKTKAITSRRQRFDLTLTEGFRQVETATAAGTITTSGNVSVVVTAAGVTGSPITLSVAVLNGDTAAAWAAKVRTAISANSPIAAVYSVVPAADATISLQRLAAAANDATLNLALADGTSDGVVTAATSFATQAGAAVNAVLAISCKMMDVEAKLTTVTLSQPGLDDINRQVAEVAIEDEETLVLVDIEEIDAVVAALGGLNGEVPGTGLGYIKDPRDATGTVRAIVSGAAGAAFACAVKRPDGAIRIGGTDWSKTSLLVRNLSGAKLVWTAAGTAPDSV